MNIQKRSLRAIAVMSVGILIMASPRVPLDAQAPATDCSSVAYRGFDSRLRVEPIGRVATRGERVTGFEVSNGRPIVAFERRLVAIDGDQYLALPSIEIIQSLAVDADGGLWLQQGTRLRRVAKAKLETVRTVTAPVRIHNSGHKLFLESESRGDATRLTVRTADDRGALPPFHIEGGATAAVSWNTIGVAAVVGDSLLTWPAGAKNISSLRNDKGLRTAIDVALVAPRRAVVALPNTLALVTEGRATIIALMKARVRWAGEALFVLDETWGVVWKLTGLELMGSAEADKGHALKLLRELTSTDPETHVNFQEAARLMGCEGARTLRGKRR